MTKIQKSFRFEKSDVERWQVAANRAGITLSEWIRRNCNEGFPRGSVVEVRPGLMEVAVGSSVALISEEHPLVKGKLKTCEHGAPKGHRCWQCGGLAKV